MNDFGFPDQSFTGSDGPAIGPLNTLQFLRTPTPPSPTNFEKTIIANKTSQLLDTPAASPAGAGLNGVVDLPTPGQPIFDVLGSHTCAEETSTPSPLSGFRSRCMLNWVG
jgi:hypothetical protein